MRSKNVLTYTLKTIGLAAIAAAAIMAVGMTRVTAATSQVVLQPGTVIPVTMNSDVSSNGSSVGDTFTATVDTSREAYSSILNGATLDGVVKEATPKEGDNPGTLRLAFTRLHLSNGETYPISGSLASLDSKQLTTDANGRLIAKNSNKDQKLSYAGIGAGVGALAGLLGGHHSLNLQDILIGGVVGYAAGALTKGKTQIHDVDLQPGTPVGVVLGERVRYHRTGGTAYHRTGVTAHKTFISNGIKHYWYNGQPWTMDMATGERKLVMW